MKAAGTPTIQSLQIIAASLMAGPAVFFAVVIYFGVQAGEGAGGDPGFLGLLTLVCIVSWIGCLMARSVASKQFAARLRGKPDLSLYQTRCIIRYVLLEGPALFGAVVLMLAAFNGGFDDRAWLLLNVLPFAVLLGLGLQDLPSDAEFRELTRAD